MGFDPYKFVARREADREEGAARVWDDTYNQEKYYDAEARKQSWMQERYGLGIYKNMLWLLVLAWGLIRLSRMR